MTPAKTALDTARDEAQAGAGLPRLAVRVHGGLSPRRCVELAVKAEELAFASVWFAENQFDRGVLPAATAAALATTRLRIGLGVLNPYHRHPTLMAMEMGALDEVAGGRAVLGIGAGVPSTIRQSGLSFDRPLSAVRDAVTIARGLLRGDEVRHRGAVFAVDGARLGYRPLRAEMPIFIAALADRTLQLAGEVGDGLIIGNLCPPAYTAHAVEHLRRGAAAAGRSALPEIVKYMPCAVAVDGAAARRAVKTVIARMLSQYWDAYPNVPAVRSAIVNGSGIPLEDFGDVLQRLARGDSADRALDDQFVRAYTLAGTAAECLEQLGDHARAGVDEVAISCVGEQPEVSMGLLGEALRRRTT
jgi:5,10-methylenetetrahydromethanopterin reductase